jgi:hypothetical protein
VPGWIRNAVWWQVYPLGFVGAETRRASGMPPVHRLGRIEAWLDYAVALGASGLLLGPIFAAATHGYDTIDHFRIVESDLELAQRPQLLRAGLGAAAPRQPSRRLRAAHLRGQP